MARHETLRTSFPDDESQLVAPHVPVAIAIVDLTASGRTLAENHLVEHEQIVECTARLIANPVAHKLKAAAIDSLVQRMREAVAQ